MGESSKKHQPSSVSTAVEVYCQLFDSEKDMQDSDGASESWCSGMDNHTPRQSRVDEVIDDLLMEFST